MSNQTMMTIIFYCLICFALLGWKATRGNLLDVMQLFPVYQTEDNEAQCLVQLGLSSSVSN